MAWWAYIYLALFLIISIGAITDDFTKPKKYLFVTGDIVSSAFVVLFVISWFNHSLVSRIGYLFVPMVASGLSFEFYSAIRDMKLERNEIDSLYRYVLMATIGLIILPGYVLGTLLAFNYANV